MGMKKISFLFLAALFLITSCMGIGTPVKINDKSEVYFKGDGVTEGDAKRLGAFLLEQGVFDNEKERSVQLSREKNTYVVRFVFDKELYEKDKENITQAFKLYQWLIAENVFNKARTKVLLTNETFDAYHTPGEFTAAEKEAFLNDPAEEGEASTEEESPY